MLLGALGHDFERLVCVEMNPMTCERLRFNVLHNFADTAAVVNAAVCSATKQFSLQLGRGSTSDSIYRGTRADEELRTTTVAGRSFDDIFDEFFGDSRVHICKMDVEGAEVEILLEPNSRNRCLVKCDHLLIEMHPADKRVAMAMMLRSLGFEHVAGAREGAPGVHLFSNKASRSD
jgi:FkbM family methyltransferase